MNEKVIVLIFVPCSSAQEGTGYGESLCCPNASCMMRSYGHTVIRATAISAVRPFLLTGLLQSVEAKPTSSCHSTGRRDVSSSGHYLVESTLFRHRFSSHRPILIAGKIRLLDLQFGIFRLSTGLLDVETILLMSFVSRLLLG